MSTINEQANKVKAIWNSLKNEIRNKGVPVLENEPLGNLPYKIRSIKLGGDIEGRKSVTINNNGKISVNPTGNYSGIEGVDINVEVPDIPPILEELNVISNGRYTPNIGTDGFNVVNVNIPTSDFTTEEKTVSINKNGQTVVQNSPTVNGMTKVTINTNVLPNLQKKTVILNKNGVEKIKPDSTFEGLKEIDVDVRVPIPTFKTEELIATENKVYTPTKDGYSKVTVAVPIPPEKKIENRKSVTIYSNTVKNINPSTGFDGMEGVDVTVNVKPNLEVKEETITNNGTKIITPTLGKEGISKITINTNVLSNVKAVNLGTIKENGSKVIKASDYSVDGLSQINFNVDVQGALPWGDGWKVPDGLKFASSTFQVAKFPTLDYSDVTSFRNYFRDSAIERITVGKNKGNNFMYMFTNCDNLVEADVNTEFNTGDFGATFHNCKQLTTIKGIDVRNSKYGAFANAAQSFVGATKIAYFEIKNFGSAEDRVCDSSFNGIVDWGDDTKVAGAKQSLYNSLVINSKNRSSYRNTYTIRLEQPVYNRLDSQARGTIASKGYTLEVIAKI